MRTIIISILSLVFSIGVFAQKNVYIYSAEASNIAATQLFAGKKVCLTIKDKRVIDGKTTVKFTFDELKSAIEATIKKACSKAEFTNDASAADMAVVIGVDRYDVRFTGVLWTGIVRYDVKYNDLTEETIEGVSNRGNVMGKSTAKKVMQNSFDDANKKLISYLLDSTNE